ncbi:MAG: folylpolyglutamate synthase/dihydrofolate synthase family protein [Acutalibacteraceae bacterium]|nr:folylpolyglutamate synthase/dihydrofolate synthase family protein [Acutalibacteraceae bacterium]
MNYGEILNYIHSLGKFSKPTGLERITSALERLNNPQNGFKSIHIAGTNGKGSTSAMLAKVFQTAGYKTGLFISPFIIDFRERIQINGEFISEDDLTSYAQTVINTGVEMTEFEFITAVAFSYFGDKKCDVVIAETGLGGRLDATNTLDDVSVAVITKIGLDHSAVLGDTVEKIAAEKCGIIKECSVTVTSPNQRKEALNVIKASSKRLVTPDLSKLTVLKCDRNGSSVIYMNREYEISLAGEYQIENALTVIETVNNSGYDIPYETVKKALANTFFPARAEIISKNPLVVLDGAHNPDGAEVLAKILEKQDEKAVAIIGVMRDKDYKTVLKTTLPRCRAAVAVAVENMPRTLDCNTLAETANGYCPTETAENYDQAIEKACKIAGGTPVFVFGSLYLAGGIRQKLIDFYKNFNQPT